METQTNPYSTSTIYKISCLNTAKSHIFYIGGTTNLNNRKTGHFYSCRDKRRKNRSLYKFINENGGFNNFCFTILGEYNLKNKSELIAKEEEYIRKFNPSLNMNHANRNRQEYRNDNRERVRYINGKCYRKYRDKNRQKRRDDYRKNKKLALATARLYYLKNKDKIDKLRKRKVKCLCGCETARTRVSLHRLTEKHKLHLSIAFNNNKLFIKQKNLHNN